MRDDGWLWGDTLQEERFDLSVEVEFEETAFQIVGTAYATAWQNFQVARTLKVQCIQQCLDSLCNFSPQGHPVGHLQGWETHSSLREL